MASGQPPASSIPPSSIIVSSSSQPSNSSVIVPSGGSSSSSLPSSNLPPVSSISSSMPSIPSSLPFINSTMSSGAHPSMFHLPTGQSHLDMLVSALKPHFVAPSPISHTIPRVKNGETQEIIASLVEAVNEAEKVKVGSGSIDTVISLLLERIQVLVVQETSPGFTDSFKKVKALHSLAGSGMDPQLLAAAMSMAASTSNSLPSTSKRRRPDYIDIQSIITNYRIPCLRSRSSLCPVSDRATRGYCSPRAASIPERKI